MINEFNTNRIVKAMIVFVVFITAALIVGNLYAQQKNKDDPPKDNKNKPKVTINVNKKRNVNGKVLQYDSTYISSWSNNIPDNIDSIMKSMQDRFFGDLHTNSLDSLAIMPFGFNRGLISDSNIVVHNFDKLFGDNLGDWDKLFREHRKMMWEFFNQQPVLKAPKDLTSRTPPPSPKKEENNLKKEKITDCGYNVNI